MTNKNKKTLLLLDGNAIIHRAYHAIPPLTTDDGVQTNAVFGFTSTLLSVLEKFQPDYIVATFDLPGKNFRHEMYSDYKATRKETPEDLTPQFDLVRDVVRSMGVVIVEKEGYEADDVIGTIALQASNDKVETIIVTGDKDTLQLVDDHARVFTMSRGIHDMVLYDRELVKEKMGVTVEQISDYKGLRGDSSDNIPGVKGVGEKTAIALLTEYGDLDGVYANLDNIKDAWRKKLEADKEKAFLSKELGVIKTDVPIEPINYDFAQTSDMTFDTARKMFLQLGFTSLLKRLPDSDENNGDKIQVTTVSEKDVKKVLDNCVNKEVSISIDCTQGHLHGLAVIAGDELSYINVTDNVKRSCKQFLEDVHNKKIVFDIKNMMHELQKCDIKFAGAIQDVLLQSYVVGQNKKLTFDALVFDIFGVMFDKKDSGAQMALGLRDNEGEKQSVCEKVYYTQKLAHHFDEKIEETIKSQKEKANISTILETIEMPLIQILFDMEERGIKLDKNKFSEIAQYINKNIEEISKEIYKYAGEEFNINSTKQLRVILFDKLQIDTKNIKKTKTGFSTASSELEKMREDSPIIEKIEQYRELFKLKTTYIDVLPTLTDDNSRIHTTFNQAITSTGRLSSSEPNLQNIPIRTQEGRKMRDGFVAGDGYVLISADYSQIDLRCVAHASGDKKMIEAFNEGTDIHTMTAATVMGKKPETITKTQRASAKELNFGLIYGMGAHGFAVAAGISREEAKEFIATYFDKFSGVKAYIENTKKEAVKTGYVETLFGRRRYVPNITAKNFMLKSGAERAAINMPIQGLTADIMKLAMIAADRYIAKTYEDGDVYAILQVHDEIIFEVKKKLVKDFNKNIVRVMENVCKLKVPLVVDTETGDNWGEL
ncbi:MAG: DNA polymerase I [Patescibacteria group bacterium]|nr:DNA polymerase I [Patescibacteria group bacterium]